MPQQMAAAGRAEAAIGHPKIQQIARFLCRHMRRHEEPKMQGARGCYRNFTVCRSKGPALTCAFPVSLVLYVFMYVLFALIADHTRPTQHPHESPCFLLLSFTCNIQSASTVGSHDRRTTGSHRRQAAMAHICFLLFALFSSLLLLLAGVCSPPSCSCP